jgi:predicted CXXCH cytochrome family protein
MTQNNGSLGINADGCAGCHRAHTAQGPFLINAEDETALCLSCHGDAVTGATTDVMTGIQYALAGRSGSTQLGALRGGGFDQARIDSDNASRVAYLRSATDVSFRTKVPVTAATDVTSAHLEMTENGILNPGVVWGNGASGTGDGAALLELSCASCHNPHGNGQYRILNPIPEANATGFDDAVAVTVSTTDAVADLINTTTGHDLQVGDLVTLTGLTGLAGGDYTVVAIPNGISFKVGTLVGGLVVTDVTASGAGGSLVKTSRPVTDAPLPAVGDARNYTVIQVKGTQGTDASYLLYASQVATAAGAGSFNGIAGDYSVAGGDYLHRTVPWDPDINNACDPTVFVSPTPAACVTPDDAPNGQPGTVTSGALAGEIAFNTQITAWCTGCHTRYYADQNPNPGGEPGSSPAVSRNISSTTASNDRITTSASHGFVVGDVVLIAGITSTPDLNGSRTVITVPTSTTFTVGVDITADGGAGGTVIRTSDPQSASSWWFPAPGEDIYKYQHRTVPNRACTTCHVSHGSNAQMTGPFSSTVTYPDGTTVSDSSRLLKIDNRGTCQACHDPTETTDAGSSVNPGATVP